MNKFKTYAFWLALSSAVVILIQSVGKLFGFEIDSVLIENVVMSICGVLVVLGIITKTDTQEKEIKVIEEESSTDISEKQPCEDEIVVNEDLEEQENFQESKLEEKEKDSDNIVSSVDKNFPNLI